MTAPERLAEAAETTVVYQAAMTMLGFKSIAEAIALWADVSSSPKQVNATSGRWITYALSLVGKRRAHARALTLSYVRLQRALVTGYTIHNPLDPESPKDKTSLADLREEFYDGVEELAPEIYEDTPQDVPGAHAEDTASFDIDAPAASGDDEVTVEVLENFGIKDLEDIEALSEEEARIVLAALGPDNLLKKYEKLDSKAPSGDVDRARTEAHRAAGNRQAAAAERLVLNGGRDLTHELIRKDHRVVAYARVSRTGTPCGFCAMLISRGPIYKTKFSATYSASGDEYHDNCHCEAVPVYSVEHYDRDESFDTNREYDQLWSSFFGEVDSDDALSDWRSFIRFRYDHEGSNASAIAAWKKANPDR